ncbi:MAG: hypothetical protein ACKPKO_37205, partial [Candidatus Fonsibacter sp.]
MDLLVFVQPENSAAVAAAAETISGNDFIPRRDVVENLIKHHRAMIEKFDKANASLIYQLLINRNKCDEHKQHLEELFAEQAQFLNQAASAS